MPRDEHPLGAHSDPRRASLEQGVIPWGDGGEIHAWRRRGEGEWEWEWEWEWVASDNFAIARDPLATPPKRNTSVPTDLSLKAANPPPTPLNHRTTPPASPDLSLKAANPPPHRTTTLLRARTSSRDEEAVTEHPQPPRSPTYPAELR